MSTTKKPISKAKHGGFDQQTDLQLLERWRAGSAQAGHTLFSRYFDSLYRFFRHKCQGDADDLVQSTIMLCLRDQNQFEGRSSFRTYLYSIARHQLYGYLRKLNRERERLNFGVSSIAEIVTTLTNRIEKDRAGVRIRQALNMIPVDQQSLLEMHYWHDLDAGELAEIFAVPRETIRTRLFRARARLRKELKKIDTHSSAIDLEQTMHLARDSPG